MATKLRAEANHEPEYDTCNDFARAFNVSDSSVRRGIAKGEIYAIKVFGSIRIPRSERERMRKRRIAELPHQLANVGMPREPDPTNTQGGRPAKKDRPATRAIGV